ncbi:GPI biosynthesis protein Pig-F [Syncephalastrum racemosum]|uniref:GPI biosynthesis protein Pig-F n=1 Tax=Syncephalastrum racemosum TaxID=13706 RepID=A0A1X2HVJ0_SYNRA|nr:GPI biosynthesis protein Pig-F [Syncephalastrum racemosum]
MPLAIPHQLATGFVASLLNYAATFIIPSSRLLQDPLDTLSTAIPILALGHATLLVLTLLFIKHQTVKQTLSSLGFAILAAIVGVGVLHGLIVLFGAPLLDKFNHTLAFATYLSIITVIPTFTALAPADSSVWVKAFLQHCPTETVEIYAYSQAICTLSGAWIGAIVLPLDWERDWQVWPISCIISTYLGHSVGVMAAFGWSSFKMVFGKKKTD